MGRQWNTIIESLGPLSGGTMSINANLTEIEALLTTLQADVADGITVSSGTVTANVPLNQDTYAGNEGIRVVGNGSDGALRIGGYDANTGTQLNLEEGGGIPIFVCASGGGTQPLPISGTVTANISTSTSGGTGAITATSTTFATALASNTSRKGATIFNEGAGLMHISLGTATTSTSQYSVRLSAGDYYEVPFNYTGQIGYIFATAGTARVTEIT